MTAATAHGRTGRQSKALGLVTGLLDAILEDISLLAEETLELLTTGAQPASSDAGALRPRIHAILSDHTDLVIGAGVAFAPDVLSDQGRYLEWWWHRAGRGAESLRVNLEPTAPDFYDYTTTDWYTTPQRTGRPHVSGPYVDYACTNSYALTLAHPVVTPSGVGAIVGADVPLSRFEARALPLLSSRDRCIVVNGYGRVILSTVPDILPATRWPSADGPKTGHRRPYGDWQLLRPSAPRD